MAGLGKFSWQLGFLASWCFLVVSVLGGWDIGYGVWESVLVGISAEAAL